MTAIIKHTTWILWTVLVGAIFGGAIYYSVPANAEPDDLTYAYANTWSAAVCETLDSYPTLDGVTGVAIGIHNDGLSWYQTGQVIGWSVTNHCTRHLALVLTWANQHKGQVTA